MKNRGCSFAWRKAMNCRILCVTQRLFLLDHARELHRLKDSDGLEGMVIDFGLTFSRDNAAQFSYLPPELLRVAADVNCGIEVSYYDLG